MNFNFIAILAALSSLSINFGINKKQSVLGFLIWYGISFLVVWVIFVLFTFFINLTSLRWVWSLRRVLYI